MVILLIVFMCSNSLMAADETCVMNSHGDADFIVAAVNTLNPDYELKSLVLNRKNETDAKVAIESADGKSINLLVTQDCKSGKLIITADSNPRDYVCQTGWIDCMPQIGAQPSKYCSKDYPVWAEKNCEGNPKVAH